MKQIKITCEDLYVYDMQYPITDEFKIGIIEITGFLIKETENRYVVAREVFTSHNNEVRGVIAIPKSCVKTIEYD